MNANHRCIAHLQSGGLLLTADLRQARIYRRLHDRAQSEAGMRAWPTAQVLPLDAWMQLAWKLAAEDRPDLPVLLPPVAVRWLWAREVARTEPGLPDPAGLASDARSSWLKLRGFGGDIRALGDWPLTRDQRAFHTWSGRVESEFRGRAAWDGGDVARVLVEASALPRPGPPILLAGIRPMPAEAALFDALRAAGHSIETLDQDVESGECRRYRARDPESERNAMLAWLAGRIEAAPAGLHAAIVPNLDADRGALERALAATLQPSLELPAAERPQRIFDLAGGRPLLAHPIAASAIDAIAAALGDIGWQDASRLLLSPHLAGFEAERAARLAAEQRLREPASALRLSGKRLSELAVREGAAEFAAAARAAMAAVEGPGRRPAGAWAEAFGRCLACWGWARGASPGSDEFQAARRFAELLREFAGLATVAGELDAAAASIELRRLLAAPYQAESGEPAVFVLDAREPLGVRFDSLWVAGLTAAAWPRPAAVDALLPIEIQRTLGMPGVTAERCVGEAREVIAAWRAGSAALVLSSPMFENDTEVDASPLIPADSDVLGAPDLRVTRDRLAFDRADLEPVRELPLPSLSVAAMRGGARVLELQAQCPFRAFAELRLGAAPVEEPSGGVDRRLRGTALHRALQSIWSRLGNRSALVRLGEAARRSEVEKAVDSALAAVAPHDMPVAAVGLERDWQRMAIGRLLALDAVRPDFTVAEIERTLDIVVGGIGLSLRVDRVDRVGDELVVIDYKTGKSGGGAWRGARMDAPQLPLYAVMHPGRPTGIAFAEVGAAAARYRGIARDAAVLAGMRAAEKFELTEAREKGFEWTAVSAHWRAWLEQLAVRFAAGHAAVDPKLGAATCRRCHLETLCRVEDAASDDHGAGDGDDE